MQRRFASVLACLPLTKAAPLCQRRGKGTPRALLVPALQSDFVSEACQPCVHKVTNCPWEGSRQNHKRSKRRLLQPLKKYKRLWRLSREQARVRETSSQDGRVEVFDFSCLSSPILPACFPTQASSLLAVAAILLFIYSACSSLSCFLLISRSAAVGCRVCLVGFLLWCNY